MNDQLWEQAKQLSKRKYSVQVLRDQLTDGTDVYIAGNPELEGCKAQGKTIEEALNNLNEARIDYIYSLLEDGLPVPTPKATTSVTGTVQDATTVIVGFYVSKHSLEEEAHDNQSVNPDVLYEASLKT